jgi:O-antigen/teichoic acid export membrane protein
LTDASAERLDSGADVLAEHASEHPEGYGRGARVLSAGIAATGLFTFAYFALADHLLDAELYGSIALLWAILFVVISVLYRPVEQLLSHTIAARRARGLHGGHPLRQPLALQAAFATTFLAVSLALRPQLEELLGGSSTLAWIFIGAGAAYAASYFARGYFAGHGWFGLYGGLVLFESLSRFCFPVAVAVGIASGQTAIALGILAAPLASLLVVPWAIGSHARLDAEAPAPAPEMTVVAGTGFALSVAGIQLAEQTLLNAGVIVANDVASAAVAGLVFNALLITRAPLQLFQAVQTSLLPHLTGLEETEGHEAFARAVRVTVLTIAAFAGLVALGLLLIGPWVMELVFGEREGFDYERWGLAVVGLGMGAHLVAGTLNQALLARGRAAMACVVWAIGAVAFVAWMLSDAVDDVLLRAETGYAVCATLIAGGLLVAYTRRPGGGARSAPAATS